MSIRGLPQPEPHTRVCLFVVLEEHYWKGLTVLPFKRAEVHQCKTPMCDERMVRRSELPTTVSRAAGAT